MYTLPIYKCLLTTLLVIVFTALGCRNEAKKPLDPYAYFTGRTMGTTYNIVFKEKERTLNQESVDSILFAINMSASTYIDSSTISKINNEEKYGQKVEIIRNGQFVDDYSIDLDRDPHFMKIYEASEALYYETDGSFDPTVMPLVNYWGFGYTPKVPVSKVDTQKVNGILKIIGLDKFNLAINQQKMRVIKPATAQLDFSALAKGYAVDYLGEKLMNMGVANFMVEIGGEVFAKGLSPKGRPWVIGINTPDETSALNEFSDLVKIDGKGMASSGNYRNYHVIEGQKYGHEINPATGFPEINTLLGTTVIAATCMEADALATALMVMGKSKSEKFIRSRDGVEALLFYSDKEGQIQMVSSDGYYNYKFDPSAAVIAN